LIAASETVSCQFTASVGSNTPSGAHESQVTAVVVDQQSQPWGASDDLTISIANPGPAAEPPLVLTDFGRSLVEAE
jgi:hypothetical protein